MDTVQETERPQARVIRARRHVPALRESVNVSALERFDNDTEVTIDLLIESGVIKNPKDGVKILGNGELTKKLTVKVNAFSESAKAKIEELGGKAEVI